MFQKNGEKARFRSTQNPIKITVRKSLKIKYHFSAKIQGIYFKIQGTYFKISALYFLQHALCFLREIFYAPKHGFYKENILKFNSFF